jgi:hypothetical protein
VPIYARRDIGPVGIGARLTAGSLAVAAAVLWFDVTAWDLAAAAVAFPALAALAARRLSSAAMVLAVVLAGATALTFVTPVDAPAIWLFLGASMIVAAIRGDAACEVLAVGNAILNRRGGVACILFAPVDAVEARRWSSRH